MAQQKRPIVSPLSGKPPPPAGGMIARAAPVRKGIVPPLMHRQKVEVMRSRLVHVPVQIIGAPTRPPKMEMLNAPVADEMAEVDATIEPASASPPTDVPLDMQSIIEVPAIVTQSEEPAESHRHSEEILAEIQIEVTAANPLEFLGARRSRVARKRTWRQPLFRYAAATAVALGFLVISAIVAGIWIHSLDAVDRAVIGDTAGRYYWVESWEGAIYCHIERDPRPVLRDESIWRVDVGDLYMKKDAPPRSDGAAWIGVRIMHAPVMGGWATNSYFVVSYWLLVLLLLLPPLWWLRNRRRLLALCRTRHCMGCGYDLRFTPHRCPECGMPGPASDSMTDSLIRQFRQHE